MARRLSRARAASVEVGVGHGFCQVVRAGPVVNGCRRRRAIRGEHGAIGLCGLWIDRCEIGTTSP